MFIITYSGHSSIIIMMIIISILTIIINLLLIILIFVSSGIDCTNSEYIEYIFIMSTCLLYPVF